MEYWCHLDEPDGGRLSSAASHVCLLVHACVMVLKCGATLFWTVVGRNTSRRIVGGRRLSYLRLRHEVCDTTEVKWLACLGCGDVALGGLILLCRLGVCVVSSSPCEAREFDVDVRVDPMLLRTMEVSGCGVALPSGVCCQFTCGEARVSCLCAFSACLHSH